MRSSKPVIADGALIAVAAEGGASGKGANWFLLAIDPRLDALDHMHFADAAEVERAAISHLRRHHPGAERWPSRGVNPAGPAAAQRP